MSEHLQNIRRMAERGLQRALQSPKQGSFVDMFQHILDEFTRHEIEHKQLKVDKRELADVLEATSIRLMRASVTNSFDYGRGAENCKLAQKHKEKTE